MNKSKLLYLVKGIAVIIIVLFILGLSISYIFNVDFVEKYIDDDNRVGEHVRPRINIFQNQILFL